MAAAKPEVVLTLEINNIVVKFIRISPILLQKYVAWIIAELLVNTSHSTASVEFKMEVKKLEVVIILDI